MIKMDAQPDKTGASGEDQLRARPGPALEAPEAAVSPAERRKRKVRDAIIEAAEDVFALEGEAGLSMRRLADRIDYSPAAIYKYFSSKDELLGAIREQFFDRLLSRLGATTGEGATGRERFLVACRAYVHAGLENPNHYRMAFANLGDGPPAEGTRGYEAAEYLTALVVGLVKDGVFRDVEPMAASTSVWASCHGLTDLMTSIPDFPEGVEECAVPLSRDQLIEAHIDLICRGLERR